MLQLGHNYDVLIINGIFNGLFRNYQGAFAAFFIVIVLFKKKIKKYFDITC